MNKNGIFIGKDSFDTLITLEWKEVKGHTDELNKTIKNLADLFASAYVQMEVEFAQKKPNDVSNDFMLKPLAHLITRENDSVNWDLFSKKTQDHLKQFMETMDWKESSNPNDIHYFVIAKDKKSNRTIGAIQFFTSPDFEKGSIKAALFGVIPNMQNRGIERLLMSSIFRIKPDIKRIFLHTRTTNSKSINLFKKWGFKQFPGKLPNWIDLEYIVNQSDILQKSSEKLSTQK